MSWDGGIEPLPAETHVGKHNDWGAEQLSGRAQFSVFCDCDTEQATSRTPDVKPRDGEIEQVLPGIPCKNRGA